MATASTGTICVFCNKKKTTYVCQGCSEYFCLDHLPEHRKNLNQQLDQIGHDHDGLRQNLNEQKTNPVKHPLIKQTADQCRETLINSTKQYLPGIEKKLNDLAEQIKEMHRENEFNEIDLKHLQQILQKIQGEFLRTPNLSVERQSTSFIDNISVLTRWDTRWKQFGMTIAGGNGQGKRLDQLSRPFDICIDNDQAIYIADWGNARIVEWTWDASSNGRIVVGRNGPGRQTNQLNEPTNIIIDRENNSLIIAYAGNRRVMRWSRPSSLHGQIIIDDIDCCGLTMHKDGFLYVSDHKKNEVRRSKKGEKNGTIVSGGNGQGNHLNQLHAPTYIFVDDDHALYVSDERNHRVRKWLQGSKEGMVVAGGNGRGDHATQLSSPSGVIVDQFGQIYVADSGNDRVMRWYEGAKQGTMVVGGNGRGEQAYQLHWPMGLSFDVRGNLYVADWGNSRIQKFLID